MSYNILHTTEDTVKISCMATIDGKQVKQVVTLPLATWSVCKEAIDKGMNVWLMLNAFVQTKANSAKAISAEQAEKAEKAARINAAIETFQANLASHTWSGIVNNLVIDYQDAKDIASDDSDAPMPVLDLNVLRRLEGKLAASDSEVWSYHEVSRQGGFYVYEIKTKAPPDFAALIALKEAKLAFQVACHKEAMTLADPILNSEVKSTNFDLNEEGQVVYNANIKGNSGSGTRTRGPWLYSGTEFPALTGKVFKTVATFAIEAGLSTSTDKYPHASAKKYRENGSLVKTDLPIDYS